ncbi:hypothetical protein TcG_01125 [Trypanosoma cruzi]|nr:hypothetical protein TcG_01125 [Trypanosoma cruzi]
MPAKATCNERRNKTPGVGDMRAIVFGGGRPPLRAPRVLWSADSSSTASMRRLIGLCGADHFPSPKTGQLAVDTTAKNIATANRHTRVLTGARVATSPPHRGAAPAPIASRHAWLYRDFPSGGEEFSFVTACSVARRFFFKFFQNRTNVFKSKLQHAGLLGMSTDCSANRPMASQGERYLRNRFS